MKIMFLQKMAILTFFLITTHQLIIALSTYYLIKLIKNYQHNEDLKYNLLLYFFCMIFPYIPAFLSFVSLRKWINDSHYDFIKNLINGSYFFPNQLNNTALKDKFESILSRNSFMTINGYFSFVHDASSLLLNSIFSMIIIGFLLPSELVVGYLISVILSITIIIISQKKIESLAMLIELKFIDYSALLAKAWSNLSLQNKLNVKSWREEFEQESNDYYKGSMRLEIIKQGINSILAAVALLPTAYLIFHVIFNGSDNPAVIAAIIVNLTRIFTILSSLNSLLHLLVELPVMNGHLKVLCNMDDFVERKISSIPYGNITMNGQPVNDYKDVIAILSTVSSGRYTLRGSNGSGKSTLIFYLKEFLGYNAILMPTTHNMMMWGLKNDNLSTGQIALQTMNQITSQEEKFLLLDEWDSNLDKDNKLEIDALLQKISMTKIVVEIKH